MGLTGAAVTEREVDHPKTYKPPEPFVVLYCNLRSLPFLGLLGLLVRQLKV